MPDFDVIIIGAGVSGLCCARSLSAAGLRCRLIEKSDAVGGRVRTDVVDGFQLDRGFQVFLTAYPEAKSILDYHKLKLNRFKSGAIVRYGKKFCRIADVLRHPLDFPATLFSPAATISDKLKIAALKKSVARLSLAQIEQLENITTADRLRQFGFSDRVIISFFKPFFGGVFLENELTTSRRMFDFVFKMFAAGDATLPEAGIQQIPEQLAESLPNDSVLLNTEVSNATSNQVHLTDGTNLSARAVVIATDAWDAQQLSDLKKSEACGVTCIYFAADHSPINEPILVLNGEAAEGPINNLCVPSDVAPNYAPDKKALISVSVIGTNHGDDLVEQVIDQLKTWYGNQIDNWQHLRSYRIENALPIQTCHELDTVQKPLDPVDGIYRCGDYLNYASLQGAMETGRKTAELIAQRNSR